MTKQRLYYGTADDRSGNEIFFAVVTGQMADGTLVYTEVAHREDGSVIKENGEYKLILDNQYRRTLKYGMQLFFRL